VKAFRVLREKMDSEPGPQAGVAQKTKRSLSFSPGDSAAVEQAAAGPAGADVPEPPMAPARKVKLDPLARAGVGSALYSMSPRTRCRGWAEGRSLAPRSRTRRSKKGQQPLCPRDSRMPRTRGERGGSATSAGARTTTTAQMLVSSEEQSRG